MAVRSLAQPPMQMPTRYEVVHLPVEDQAHHLLLAIRRFTQDGSSKYLLIDPETLTTSVQAEASMKATPERAHAIETSPYARALRATTAPPWPLQNQGLTRAFAPKSNVAYLTVDMCPSSRAFDEAFFQRLAKFSETNALPLTIDVSGMWIQHHQESFAWLRSMIDAGKLRVTWVNHAYRHRYAPSKPLRENFLLMRDTDFDAETLSVEKLLLAYGVTPSVFIRYPGLVSDAQIVKRTYQLGLIPLGADAWLAKGQKISDGSIVLVHGNGNEPAGLALLTTGVLQAHHWHPINEAAMPETTRPSLSEEQKQR